MHDLNIGRRFSMTMVHAVVPAPMQAGVQAAGARGTERAYGSGYRSSARASARPRPALPAACVVLGVAGPAQSLDLPFQVPEGMEGALSSAARVAGDVAKQAGPAFDQFRSEAGPAFDQFRSEAGPAFNQLRSEAGPAFDQFRSQAGPALGQLRDVATKAAPIFQDAMAKMAPAVDDAGSAVAGKLLPALESAAGSLGRMLQSSSGPEVARFVDGLTTSMGGLASGVGNVLDSADGNVQVAAVGAAVLLFALSPAIVKVASSSLRGYTGNVPASLAAEELLAANSLLVDIRADPARDGIPEMRAGRMRAKYVSVPIRPVSDPAVRAGDLMSSMAALKISALKPKYLSAGKRGTRVYVLDDFGRDAPAVAKKLTGVFGVKTVYVISGGFGGRQGWSESGLPVRGGRDQGVLSTIGTQFARE